MAEALLKVTGEFLEVQGRILEARKGTTAKLRELREAIDGDDEQEAQTLRWAEMLNETVEPLLDWCSALGTGNEQLAIEIQKALDSTAAAASDSGCH